MKQLTIDPIVQIGDVDEGIVGDVSVERLVSEQGLDLFTGVFDIRIHEIEQIQIIPDEPVLMLELSMIDQFLNGAQGLDAGRHLAMVLRQLIEQTHRQRVLDMVLVRTELGTIMRQHIAQVPIDTQYVLMNRLANDALERERIGNPTQDKGKGQQPNIASEPIAARSDPEALEELFFDPRTTQIACIGSIHQLIEDHIEHLLRTDDRRIELQRDRIINLRRIQEFIGMTKRDSLTLELITNIEDLFKFNLSKRRGHGRIEWSGGLSREGVLNHGMGRIAFEGEIFKDEAINIGFIWIEMQLRQSMGRALQLDFNLF